MQHATHITAITCTHTTHVRINYYWPSYYVSRFNFTAAHLFVVFYWLPFLLNNPLNFPLVNTIDAKVSL